MRSYVRWVWGIVGAVGLSAMVLPASAADQKPFDWKRFSGTTITFLSENHPWPAAVLKHIDEFTKLTGINVRVETFAEQQSLQRLTTLLQQKSADIDVYMALKAWNGQLYYRSGWYYDLTSYINDASMTSPDYDFDDFYRNLLELPAYDDKVVVIPLNIEGPLLYWRKDIFEKCNVQPPNSVEEIEPVAAKLKACRSDIVPFATRGLRSSVGYTLVPMWYNLGGNYDKIQDKKSWCTEVGAQALKYYTDLLNNYGPPGVANYTFYQITEILGQGRAAMTFSSSNEFGKVMSYPGREDDLSVKVLPAGAKSKVSSPLVIDWGIAVSAFTKHPGAAWYFVQWATSKEIDDEIALEGIAPPRKSVQNSPRYGEWVAAKPVRQQWIEALDEISKTGVTTILPPSMINVPEGNDAIGEGMQEVMLGQKKPMDAGCEIDERILVDFR